MDQFIALLARWPAIRHALATRVPQDVARGIRDASNPRLELAKTLLGLLCGRHVARRDVVRALEAREYDIFNAFSTRPQLLAVAANDAYVRLRKMPPSPARPVVYVVDRDPYTGVTLRQRPAVCA